MKNLGKLIGCIALVTLVAEGGGLCLAEPKSKGGPHNQQPAENRSEQPQPDLARQLREAKQELLDVQQLLIERGRNRPLVCFAVALQGKPTQAGFLTPGENDSRVEFNGKGVVRIWLPGEDGYCSPSHALVCHDSDGQAFSRGASISEHGVTYKCAEDGSWTPSSDAAKP